MATSKQQTAANTGAEMMVIERTFDAPRELVWRAWTEPEHFMRWWGPKDFTSPRCEIDLRVGGAFLWCMRWPDGRENYNGGRYDEIVPHERLVYTTWFADAAGNLVPPSHYGIPDDGALDMQVTVTFEERAGRTTMTVAHAGIAGDFGEDTRAGWNESFDKLAASLK